IDPLREANPMSQGFRKFNSQLRLEELESRATPASAPWQVETFDPVEPGRLPGDWDWAGSSGANLFSVSADVPFAPDDRGLISAGRSDQSGLAWVDRVLPPDVEASVSVYLDSLNPAYVFVRGRDLDAAPDYYALRI